MKKKIIISDTNIIIYLCTGNAFEQFCSYFSVHVTIEVLEEIKKGRASKDVINSFFKEYQQDNLVTIDLETIQIESRDSLMNREKIGIGEASCIIAAYDLEDSFFATNDGPAFKIAQDLLGSDHVLGCEEILEAMLRIGLLTEKEFEDVKRTMTI